MSGQWLGLAFADEEGFCLAGRPRGRAADLHVAPDGVMLRAWPSSARLRWEDYQPRGLHTGILGWAGWDLTHLRATRSVAFGVAVEVAGPMLLVETGRVRGTTTPRWDASRFFDRRALVPLEASVLVRLATPAERDTLRALLAVLARRRDLRPRLGEADRARALLRAMAARPLTEVAVPAGLRWTTYEAIEGMRRLGYGHRIGGRPVPGDQLAPLEEIVRRTVHHAGRKRGGVTLDPATVARLARRYYLDVEPWPFAALADDAPPPSIPPRPLPSAPAPPPRVAPPTPEQVKEPPAGRPVPDGYGAGHKPSWWRSTPPWAPKGDPE